MDSKSKASKSQTKVNSVQPQVTRSAPAPLAALGGIGLLDLQSAVENPAAASPQAILKLQRMYGNQAVQRLLTYPTANAALQREPVGMQGGELDASLDGEINSARGGGQPLDGALGSTLGNALGTDFSGVKVHTGTKADALNRSLSAKAFTTGSDIFFSQGAYSPGTSGGRHLLAHELTHVMQQGAAKASKVQPLRAPAGAQRAAKPNKHPAKRGAALIQREITGVVGPKNDAVEKWKQGKQASALRTKPDSVEQLAKGADANTVYWASNDDVLWQILKGPFESHWFKARESLTMNRWPSSIPPANYPKHETGLRLMNALVDMRWRKWRPFADELLTRMTKPVQDTAQKPQMAKVKGLLEAQTATTPAKDHTKIFNPVGSQAVTSDIDLSMGGKNSEIAVGFINKEFRAKFEVPYDPGTVFDINVYASDWIHGADEKGSTEKLLTPRAEVTQMSEEARGERDDRMEIWSLVKAHRSMDESAWLSYTRGMLSGFPEGDARKPMEKKLRMAEFEYRKFMLNIKMKLREIDSDITAGEKLLYGAKKSAYDEQYQESARETRASNAIYEDLLLEVKALRLQLSQLSATDPPNVEALNNVGKRLGSKIAEALTYANEVYATEGAVQHTVLEQGKGKKLKEYQLKDTNITSLEYDLRPQLFLQSVNENVGDSLHSLHAYHDMPRYSVYRAGKYISRLIEATEKAVGSEASSVPNFGRLKDIGKQAMAIKSEKVMVHDQEMEGDPAVVERSTFFQSIDVSATGIHHLEEQIIAFGARVPALFHVTRANRVPPANLTQESPPSSPPASPIARSEPVPLISLKQKIADFQKMIDQSEAEGTVS